MAMVKGGLFDGAGSENEQDQEEQEESSGGRNKFLRLPYALAKERGLDTTGLTPRQVWELLKGMGLDPMGKLAEQLGNDTDTLKEQEQAEYELGQAEQLAKTLKANGIDYAPNPNATNSVYNGTDKELVDKNLRRLGELIDKYPVNGNLKISSSNNMRAVASYRGYSRLLNILNNQPTVQEIRINRDRYKSTENLARGYDYSTESQKGFGARCDDDKKEVFTITHEYGHHIFGNIRTEIFKSSQELQKELSDIMHGYYSSGTGLQKSYDRLNERLDQIMIDGVLAEYKKIEPNYPTYARGLPFISYYGNGYSPTSRKIKKGSNAEWLAETFAELNCTSKPRSLCIAMQNYLKSKGVAK